MTAASQLMAAWRARSGAETEDPLRLTPDLLIRMGLVALLVIVCYKFDWRLLRSLTCECILRLSVWLGLGMRRISFDAVQWSDMQFQFSLSCTQVDVFCGSLPLLWNLAAPIWKNVVKSAAFFVCLFAFNIVRLEVGYVLYALGIPWIVAHDFIAGVGLFLIFLWLMRQRRGSSTPREARALAVPRTDRQPLRKSQGGLSSL
jgi:hypothetical protein